MAPRRRIGHLLALPAAALALGLAAGVALGAVTIYKNDFSTRSEAKQLRRTEGKHCTRRLRKVPNNLLVKAKQGPEVCGYRPPVEGDSSQPNHKIQLSAKLLKSTPKGIRRGAYVSVAVRVGGKPGYELRIFPKKHRYQLLRKPSGGGGDFPAQGHSTAIKGTAKKNVLRLDATGDKVTAKVNGTTLTSATDSSPSQVAGRRLEIAVGNRRHSSKPVSFALDDLKVQLPNP